VTLDFSASAIVDAGSGLLFFAIGLGAIITSRGRPRALALGALCCVFGAAMGINNLYAATLPIADSLLFDATAILAVAMGVILLRRAPPSGLAIGVAPLVLGLVSILIWIPGFFSTPLSEEAAAFTLMLIALAALAGACSVAYAGVTDLVERRALVLLALAFGLYPAFKGAWNFQINAYFGRPDFPLYELPPVIASVASTLAWIPGPRTPERRLARNVVLAFALSAMAGAFFIAIESTIAPNTLPADHGSPGFLRTVAAAALAWAILRFDLLGVPLPRIVVRRGTVATIALALLFIVAQVAQNFFAAQYGLLLGGVIAGCFLFAAQPVQRMIERRGERRVGVEPARSAAELAFKAAVRAALALGPLTREHDPHLAEVAHHLGIGAREMVRLTREVEREAASVRIGEAES
jgi:hypothetical protein